MRRPRPPISYPTMVVIGLLSFGCAEERPTGNNSGGSFPTANLTDDLVIRVSEPVTASALTFNDSAGLYVSIPDSLFTEFGSNADMYITHSHCSDCYCGPDKFEVFDHSESVWAILDEPSGVYSCLNIGAPRQYYGYSRLLSPIKGSPLVAFLDSGNRVRVRGNFHDVKVQLATLSSSFVPQLIREGAFHADLAWSEETLMVALSVTRREGRTSRFEWRDADGNVLRDAAIEGEPFYTRRFFNGNGSIWTWSDNGFQLHGESGEVLETIVPRATIPFSISWGFAFWMDSQLWTLHNLGFPPQFSGRELIAIDIETSRDSGFTVFGATRPFPSYLTGAKDIESDGEVLHILKSGRSYWEDGVRHHEVGHILTVDVAGRVTDSIVVPVLADCIAWDGEAYWMVHRGTPELPSTDVLLSRFYPR